MGLLSLFALVMVGLAFAPAVLACGGGGSGSYRKPPRPGHHLENKVVAPQPETSAGQPVPSAKN